MTTIKVICPCGASLTLAPADVRLVTCEHGAFYVYACAACGEHPSVQASPQVLDLLLRADVKQIVVTSDQGTGDAISEDDVIAFGLQMQALPSALR